MKYRYNVKERKPFAKALQEITGEKAAYLGTPSYAYQVGIFTITREGNLTFDETTADQEEVDRITWELAKRGYDYEPLTQEDLSPSVKEPEAPQDAMEEPTGLTISMPLDKVGVGNLTNLLDAKENLIKKALGVNDIRIIIEEDKVSFPWFEELPKPEEINAYTQFIAALCKMSKEQKRISATQKETDNEKYAFRCFLLRLGFIGDEYKQSRKILLKNLSGSSAFKNGAAKEVQ
ncbi:virulence protein [Clostridioides difficile]|nr:virulence protein [Clostridioides difficile]MCJ0380964.1 virulence protein [Clostridioides difficile]MDB0376632.1 virulence protein [Clostridioides difficile]MDB0394932.1 virulence protein [Clostridioides difficile]HBE8721275.1 virulence protein [Clostridioides difficile]